MSNRFKTLAEYEEMQRQRWERAVAKQKAAHDRLWTGEPPPRLTARDLRVKRGDSEQTQIVKRDVQRRRYLAEVTCWVVRWRSVCGQSGECIVSGASAATAVSLTLHRLTEDGLDVRRASVTVHR